MQQIFSKTFSLFLLFCAVSVFGQNRCLTKAEANKVIETIQVPPVVREDKELRKELLKMRETRDDLNQKISENFAKNQKLVPQFNQLGETHLLRLCQIVKEKGWLTKELVREDGVQAMLWIIRNNRAFQLQTEFYPVLVEASKKGFVPKSELASIVDSVRVGVGQPQLFGTQAKIKDDVIYIHPLLNEEKVDEWRKEYDLPSLSIFIRQLELRYLMNVLKSPPSVAPTLTAKNGVGDEVSTLGISNDENEVLKIDTKLVNLNVRILNKDLSIPADLKLNKEDFSVLENGQEQEISFFSATDTPFDLVLLLDFSGSTVEKRDLIKQAAQRFVEVARPNDRISVVIFTGEVEVISNLTSERAPLIEKIKQMDTTGGSYIWQALKFTYENIIQKQSAGRRSAIVFMTDGEDNGRDLNFADAFEIARINDSTIFPVYLEGDGGGNDFSQRIRQKSRQSLWLLAEETGGTAYQVKKIKDLSGIYEQIVNDLGKVYSVGYEPQNVNRDGAWRNLTVKLKTRTDLIAKTRRGYYAK
jgi:VWFA-related protein